ncbi:uncharacterized protein B0H18DRAFT_532182 [Fomitopsis serialis]|uniref:uncharacterized protein n=1 Tax=Fomitopsis serialis TaxID=139415 RepID=UPI0020086187|nr:uncharacterized protein B0H18DRAFT_532182 [Neoantrodia serialis]KAH9921874.1 hypothetical protein B0H18DRAFT_532182 [Neoantrodia serialis]
MPYSAHPATDQPSQILVYPPPQPARVHPGLPSAAQSRTGGDQHFWNWSKSCYLDTSGDPFFTRLAKVASLATETPMRTVGATHRRDAIPYYKATAVFWHQSFGIPFLQRICICW